MKNIYLEDDKTSRLEQSDIDNFIEKYNNNTLSLTDIDCLYVGLSSEAQDGFLETLKAELPEEEYLVAVKHFKSLTLMDKNRAKTKTVCDYIALAYYEQFKENL